MPSKRQSDKARKEQETTAILQEIDAEQQSIAAEEAGMVPNEGRMIGSLIRLGRLFIDLKQLAKRTWTRELQQRGHHPRVARRLQKLGASWWGENGPTGPVLELLPTDLHKREWLCRLSEEQLRELLTTRDCKREDRPQVIAAVKAALGLKRAKPPEALPAVFKKHLDRFVSRSLAVIEQLPEEDGAALRPQLHAAVTEAFQQLKEALGA